MSVETYLNKKSYVLLKKNKELLGLFNIAILIAEINKITFIFEEKHSFSLFSENNNPFI